MCVTTSEDRARASAGIIGEKLSMGAKFFGKERWRSMTKYPMLKLLQVLCGAYICTVTFTKVGTFGTRGGLVDPESGFIIDTIFEENTNNGVILVKGDLRAVVAQTTFQMVALAVSRLSAFTMYPALIFVFLSKFRATTNFFSRTYLGYLFQAKDLHDLHAYCGYCIFINGCLHTIFHLVRFATQSNLRLLVDHPSGISGLIIIGSTILITVPMTLLKKKIRFEVRKYAHYLFLAFMLALCFHVPRSGGFAPYVFGTLLVWWGLDSLYVQFFMTERIQSSRFYVLPSGVQLTMAVSERFQKWGTGGYCYVCLPWVDPYQWHAFSLFENPLQPEERQVFMQKSGDWTNQVHDTLGRDTSRPVWVQGPFVSPYGNAANYDNQIMVAGGIGITPALSVIRELKSTRRCNLIWAARDRHMVEFFVKHADFDDNGWNLIFYTGKEPLLGIEDVVVTAKGATVYVIRDRPKLHYVLPSIIYGIESGTSLPENMVPDEKIVAFELLQEKLRVLDKEEPPLDSHEKLSDLEHYCDELGYFFSDLISQIPGANKLTNASEDAAKEEGKQCVLDAILDHGSSVLDNTESELFRRASTRSNLSRMEPAAPSMQMGSEALMPSGRIGSEGRSRRNSTLFKRNGAITTSTWDALSKTVTDDDGFIRPVDEDGDSDIEAAPLMQHQQEPYKPWEHHEEAEEYVGKLPSRVLSTWGVLYCGGKTPLEKALKMASGKARIEMHSESFAW